MLPKVPRGIVLDFDNTLVDSTAAYAAGLAAVGLTSTTAAYAAARKQVKAQVGAKHPCSHSRLLYFQAMQKAGALPQAVGPAGLLSLAAQYETAVAASIAQQWGMLGRTGLLRALGEVAPLCVLTNETTRMQLAKWAAVDPPGTLFAGFLTSEELGREKPDPAGFVAAAKILGCAVEDCLVVGDDWHNDIEPALALGQQAVWTNEFRGGAAASQSEPRTRAGGPWQIGRLADVLQLVAGAKCASQAACGAVAAE